MNNINNKLIFGFYPIRGIGAICRHLLIYTQSQWIDKHYKDIDQWIQGDKFKLGLDFPNLPYLIDGNFKMTQTTAIPLYIIKRSEKHDYLLGKNLKDQAKVNEVLWVIRDIKGQVLPLFYSKTWQDQIQPALKKITPKLQYIEKYFQSKNKNQGQKFAMGSYLTYIDFQIAQFSHYMQRMLPQQYKKYPSLQRIRQTFYQIPIINKYYQDQKRIKMPFVQDKQPNPFPAW